MMKKVHLITALTVLVMTMACDTQEIQPSSNITTQDRTIDSYTGIEIATVFDVDVSFSATEEKIEIEANENLHSYIDVYKNGTDLVIKLKDNTSIRGNATIKAHIITGNPIEQISVRDASKFFMNNELTTNEVLLLVDDASEMTAQIATQSAFVRIEGASKMNLSGTTDQLQLFAFDASELNGLGMIVKDLTAQLEGASSASLAVSGTIDLTAMDASVFTYKGDAVITNIDLQDASQIIKLP